MKHIGMPLGIWLIFGKSFKKNLTDVFGLSPNEAKSVMAKAKRKYKQIIGNLPEFEKGDRFQMNIVGCAILGALVLSIPSRPDVETLTAYYRKSLMTATMKWFHVPDIHEFDMKHEVWLYDDKWHQPVLDCVCRCMEG